MSAEILPTTSKIEKRKMITRMTHKMPVTIQQLAECMKRHKGSLSKVATELDLPVEVVRRKVRFTPELQRVKRNIIEEKLDKAEEKLDDQVENGNITAITYTLTNLAKERGYGKGNDVDVQVSIQHSAGMIKRLQQGLEEDTDWNEDEIVELEDYEWVEDDSVDA